MFEAEARQRQIIAGVANLHPESGHARAEISAELQIQADCVCWGLRPASASTCLPAKIKTS